MTYSAFIAQSTVWFLTSRFSSEPEKMQISWESNFDLLRAVVEFS